MKKTLFYTLILIIVLFFYIMNVVNPLRCDDLVYQFFWMQHSNGGVPVDVTNRIDSFGEAFRSQNNHYLAMNGRYIVHFFVQCFCGFIGKPTFNIINTVIYLLFILGCCKLVKADNIYDATLVIGILWLGLPVQYIFSFDIAFAINYLWTATAYVFYFLLLFKYINSPQKTSWTKLFFIFFCGVICGNMHEGFSLPISGATFLYYLFNKKTISLPVFLLFLGLWVGTLLVTFAPGTIARGSHAMNDSDLKILISQKLDVLRYSKRLYLLLITLCILYYKRGITNTIEFIKENSIIASTIILDFLLVLMISHYSQRMEFPLEWLSLILITKIILSSISWNKHKRYLAIAIFCILMIHVPITAFYTKQVSDEYKEMVSEFQNSEDGVTHYKEIEIMRPFVPYTHRLDEMDRQMISCTMGKEMIIE